MWLEIKMNRNILKKMVFKELDLEAEPRIIYLEQRRLSLICELIGDKRRFFLKIPEKREETNDLSELNKKIKERGFSEWQDLNYFYNLTKGDDCPISYVKPVAYISKLGGIVSEKSEGSDFYKSLIKANSEEKIEENKEVLKKIGKGLAFIHKQAKKEKREVKFMVENVNNETLDRRIKKIFSKEEEHYSTTTRNLTAIDVRNIIINPQEEILFLDPTRREGQIYRELADFLINMKILYQGKLNFPFKKVNEEYKKSFLKGYFKNKEYNERLLGLCLLARITREYNKSIRKIDKRIPKVHYLKNILVKIYLNRFYYQEIKKIIKNYGL